MFGFSFDPTVWGTVSDWVQIGATIVSLYLIYRTLKSQLVVQKTQLDLTQIEVDKYLKDDKPYFILEEFDFSHLIPIQDDPNIVIRLTKWGNLEALAFRPTVTPPCNIEVLTESQEKISSSITIMYFFKNDQSSLEEVRFVSMLFYKDRYGNNYRQVFTVYRENNEMKGHLSSPSINDRASDIFSYQH